MDSEGVKTRFMRRVPECGICGNRIHEQGLLNCCKHSFCLSCILRWAEIENSCPLCKARFSQVTLNWTRKYLREYPRRPVPTHYTIRRKDQSSTYSLQLTVPLHSHSRLTSLFHYLESILQETLSFTLN